MKKESAAHLSVAGTAKNLQVSQATVRNWLRSGAVSSLPDGGENLLLPAGRLKARANKSGLAQSSAGLEKKCAAAAVFLLKNYSVFERKCVQDEILAWESASKVTLEDVEKVATEIRHLLRKHPPHGCLGALWSTLAPAGKKAKFGAFFTPPALAEKLLAGFEKLRPEERVLDPCCGAGNFLLAALNSGIAGNVRQLTGFDIDPLAVHIARVNLLLIAPDEEFAPQIFLMDVLDETDKNTPERLALEHRFAAVVTNPPWGGRCGQCSAEKKQESFARFLRAGVRLLAPGGRGLYLLPEAFLSVKKHENIRRFMLHNSRINAIHALGRCFKKVFTPVIALDFTCATPGAKESYSINISGASASSIDAGEAEKSGVFNLEVSEDDRKILHKLMALPHVKLGECADFALGIVTGDNKRFCSETMQENYAEVIRGEDIAPFCIREAQCFVNMEHPELFHQMAERRFYSAPEKIVYRFIGRSLCCAVDTRQRLTLNSANIIVPHSGALAIRVIEFLLNSEVMDFIYRKNTGSLKVLRGNLEKLPLFLFNNRRHSQICDLTEQLSGGKLTGNEAGRMLCAMLGLTDAEAEYIMRFRSRKN